MRWTWEEKKKTGPDRLRGNSKVSYHNKTKTYPRRSYRLPISHDVFVSVITGRVGEDTLISSWLVVFRLCESYCRKHAHLIFVNRVEENTLISSLRVVLKIIRSSHLLGKGAGSRYPVYGVFVLGKIVNNRAGNRGRKVHKTWILIVRKV